MVLAMVRYLVSALARKFWELFLLTIERTHLALSLYAVIFGKGQATDHGQNHDWGLAWDLHLPIPNRIKKTKRY